MSTVRYYNPNILEDKSIPEDTRFLTSLSLKKDSYNIINDIVSRYPHSFASKGQVVDAALKYYMKYITELVDKKVNDNGE